MYRSTAPWRQHQLEMNARLQAKAASRTHWGGGLGGRTIRLETFQEIKFLTLTGLELWSLGRRARGQ
jgi:hypothetical protein